MFSALFYCLDALLVAIYFHFFPLSLLILALRHSFTPFTNFFFSFFILSSNMRQLAGSVVCPDIHKSQELIYILRLLVSRGLHSRQVRFTAFFFFGILSTGGLPCVIENS